jgi:ubiquinone/menaquinone biosynthesis C-methylase UbiE
MNTPDGDDYQRTRKYFDSWRTYQDEVSTCFSELYRNCAMALNDEIGGRVLDIGSGGIFNYDVSKVTRLVAVDYSVTAINLKAMPANVELVQGDATRLPFPDESFDCAVMQFLIHHLARRNHQRTVENVIQCMEESCRVLRRGGKLLVMESFVPPSIEFAEQVLYPLTRQMLQMFGQPMVFQFSVKSFCQINQSRPVDPPTIRKVPIGKYISQFGLKVPGALSPCQIRLVKSYKRAG